MGNVLCGFFPSLKTKPNKTKTQETRQFLLGPSDSLGVRIIWELRAFRLLLFLSISECFFGLLQIHGDTVQNQLVLQGVELPSYLPLYSPAMDWIFQCISYHAPEVTATCGQREAHAEEDAGAPLSSILCLNDLSASGPGHVNGAFRHSDSHTKASQLFRSVTAVAGPMHSASP